MKLDVDWQSICALGGSKADAFEELCAQLARATSPAGAAFIRKGTPDAGVECYAVLPSGDEWGWQAKYFSSQGDSQWAQIDESVEHALIKHPELVKYFVCVPIDLSDARISGKKSAKQRWDDRVVKWKGLATKRGMSVEFLWMGSHEMLTLLAKPETSALASFFFNVTTLDSTWFEARIQEAIASAGPRYTPANNVKLDLTDDLESFAREDSLFQRASCDATSIRDDVKAIVRCAITDAQPRLKELVEAARASCELLSGVYAGLRYAPSKPDVLGELERALTHATDAALQVVDELLNQRTKTAPDAESPSEADGGQSGADPAPDWDKELPYHANVLYRGLSEARRRVSELSGLANSRMLILNGEAGSGKTHLLCDFAAARVAAKRPTIVLMGQRFHAGTEPWTQVLQQLGVGSWSAETLIGAVEVAAQVADARALVIIDAVNEGGGLSLWPSHMAAFLSRLEASSWISVVISVRSAYEDFVIPEDVRQKATRREHRGFAGIEYDAVAAFFQFYGIELPSTPLLAAEFQNPLFLKTVCSGLRDMGEHRLPRGASGISETFNLYLRGVNRRLAMLLDYRESAALVQQAVHALAARMADQRRQWDDLAAAESCVDALLPGRKHSESLFANLLREGVLLEERIWQEDGKALAVVLVGYERMSDYFITGILLDKYLDMANPAKAFQPGEVLNFLAKNSYWPTPGVHEAMHVLVAERTGNELLDLAPLLKECWHTSNAFCQSVIWRDPKAASARSGELLLEIGDGGNYDHPTIETLLTVATLPDHPINADYLDAQLRAMTMPDRDAWWSTALHYMWGNKGAVDRLVHWAESVWPHTSLDDDAARLGAITLSWFLTTSNRFLRDRASKGLLRLLTGRPEVSRELVDKFACLDDLYVAERVLGAVYGALMRSSNATGVAEIAAAVHRLVFASGIPRPHILFRDFARGIIKRAEFLCAGKSIETRGIDLPYQSTWPRIPSIAQVDAIAPNWSSDTKDKFSWAHHRIRSSVMDDDFGRYVIGTNSGSTNFLSLRLEEPAWRSLDDRVKEAVARLTGEQVAAWRLFDDAQSLANRHAFFDRFNDDVLRRLLDQGKSPSLKRSKSQGAVGVADDSSADLERKKKEFLALLALDEAKLFVELIAEKRSHAGSNSPPMFDLKLVQRYVVARVFELGWTSARFADFDEHSVDRRGRDARKAERIGKKYQWIAYHEMYAFMADHFQFLDYASRNGPASAYKGTWQNGVRDLDVSNTMARRGSRPAMVGNEPPFWACVSVASWGVGKPGKEWAKDLSDLPPVMSLMRLHDANTSTEWLNLSGYFEWKQPVTQYQVSEGDECRDLWVACDAHFIRTSDVLAVRNPAILRATGSCYNPSAGNYTIYLGELPWAEASDYFQQPYYGDEGWAPIAKGVDLQVAPTTFKYMRETSGFDCSVADTFSLSLPHPDLLRGLGATWSGIAATYLDSDGKVVAFDPGASVNGPSGLLVRRDALDSFLERQQLAICWIVGGGKRAAEGAPRYHTIGERNFGGIFTYASGILEGALDVPTVPKRSARARAATKSAGGA
jgi:hypothetical protein